MRLCANKNGERKDQDVLSDHVYDTNIITVIACQSLIIDKAHDSKSGGLTQNLRQAADMLRGLIVLRLIRGEKLNA